MNSKFYNWTANAYFAVADFKRNPMALVQKLERGDADSSGSTLRTVGIVVLVLAVILALGIAVMGAANNAAGKINSSSFDFTP